MGGDSLRGFTGRIAHLFCEDIVCDVDGFYYFLPKRGSGTMASHHLRWMASLLDWINEPWQKDVDQYFSGNN